MSNTLTAPVSDRLGGAETSGAATPSATSRLDAAQVAHDASLENHRQALERANRAAELHRHAVIQQQRLIDEAAAGRAVDQITVTRGKLAVSEARDALDHAKLVASGANTLTERAHITLMTAEAERVRAEYNVTVANQIAKAEAVDIAYHALQAAIVEYGDVSYEVMTAGHRIDSHNMQVNAHMPTNAVLRILQPAERPTARAPAHVQTRLLKVAFVTDRWGDLAIDPIASVAALVRAGHGIAGQPQADSPTVPPDSAPLDILSTMVGRVASCTPANPAFITGGRLSR